MSIKERTTRGAPCIFCGDVGYDMRVIYPEDNVTVHWCHKTNANKGDVVTVNGIDYLCKASKKQIQIGTFDLFVKYLSKEEWMEQQKLTNPNWNTNYNRTSQKFSPSGSRKILPPIQTLTTSTTLISGEEKKLPREKLDKIYRAMLDMLVLEDKHRKQLCDEWKSPIHDVRWLLEHYPIRSLPPPDKARFANSERFKNPTRKSICSKLVSMFGDLRGVPGFSLRSGGYWSDKPESERWTFSDLEGIIFPCYDEDGYLYAIRVKVDYPNYKLAEGKTVSYNGKYGYICHNYDQNGKHTWTFYPKGEAPELLYGENINKIQLNASGCPSVGKVDGKYKNFSSVYEKLVNGKPVNVLEGGSRSGTPYSVYSMPGDSFKLVMGTEGEKKGMVGNAIRHVPVVEVAGVWTFQTLFEKKENGLSCIDVLKQKGMKYFILCYDADKEDNENVLNAETAFIEELKKHDVIPLKGHWKKQFDKGLDDILLSGLDITLSPA